MPFWHSVQELSRLVARISESAYTTAVEALAHVNQVRLQAPPARNALTASPTQSAPTFKRTRCLALMAQMVRMCTPGHPCDRASRTDENPGADSTNTRNSPRVQELSGHSVEAIMSIALVRSQARPTRTALTIMPTLQASRASNRAPPRPSAPHALRESWNMCARSTIMAYSQRRARCAAKLRSRRRRHHFHIWTRAQDRRLSTAPLGAPTPKAEYMLTTCWRVCW